MRRTDAAPPQPVQPRDREPAPETLTLVVRVNPDHVELTLTVVHLQPAEAGQTVAVVEQQEIARVEPRLVEEGVEVCARNAALLRVAREGAGIQ